MSKFVKVYGHLHKSKFIVILKFILSNGIKDFPEQVHSNLDFIFRNLNICMRLLYPNLYCIYNVFLSLFYFLFLFLYFAVSSSKLLVFNAKCTKTCWFHNFGASIIDEELYFETANKCCQIFNDWVYNLNHWVDNSASRLSMPKDIINSVGKTKILLLSKFASS